MGPSHWRKTRWRVVQRWSTWPPRRDATWLVPLALRLLKCFHMSCGYLRYKTSQMTLISHLPSAGVSWVAGLIISPVVSKPKLTLCSSYQGKLRGLATPGQREALPHTSGWDNNGLFYYYYFLYFPWSFACFTSNGAECICLTFAEIKRTAPNPSTTVTPLKCSC